MNTIRHQSAARLWRLCKLTSSTDLISHTVSICITDGSLAFRLIMGLTAHLVKSRFYAVKDIHQLQVRPPIITFANTYEVPKNPILQVRDTPEEAIIRIAFVEYLCLKKIRLAFAGF